MSEDLETRLRDWLRERGRASDEEVRALVGHVAVLPPRRPGRWRPLLAAAAVLVALAFSVSALPRFGGVGGSPVPSSPLPPDPAAFAGDHRLNACGGGLARSIYAFEMAHARDYRLHLPAMGLSPELDTDEPAFVVVFEQAHPFGASGGPGPGSTNRPGHHDVCVLAGQDPATASRTVYTDVDVAGLTVVPVTAAERPSASSSAASTARPTRTAAPVPPWASDLLGQLECDGEPQAIGHERGMARPAGHTGRASPQTWLDGRDNVDLPLAGWTEEPQTSWSDGASHYVRHVNLVAGRVKAVILMEGISSSSGTGHWSVTAFRACDPREFDPLLGRTTDDTIWTDAAGTLTRDVTTRVGPAHCGWESTTWLRRGGELFLRDPLGLFADVTAGSFQADVPLPPDAAATGYRSPRWELFTSPDPDSVWMRTDRWVERWPRATDPSLGCH